jgi:hypothetical protein
MVSAKRGGLREAHRCASRSIAGEAVECTVKNLWDARKIPWCFRSPSPARIVAAFSEPEVAPVSTGLPIESSTEVKFKD